MQRNWMTFCLFASLMFCNPVSAQDLTGIKCIVMGKRNASARHAVDYLDGKVYLCCPRCKSTFSDKTDQFSTKANHQLVVTGQYIQSACPSGANIKESFHKLNVAGVEVSFCNEEAMKNVADQSDMQSKIELVFGNAAFKKAFRKKETIDVSKARCILMPKRKANEKYSVDFENGKLYFCCKGCVQKFETKKSEAKVIARANEQLFATGQYRQKLCPVGGHEMSDDNFVEVSGNKVHVCCKNCVSQLNDLGSDAARIEKVFNQESFAKSFEPNK